MKLSVKERMLLQTILPREGNILNLKLLRVAKEELSFNEKELKALNVREIGEGKERKMVWDEKVKDKDIQLGEIVTDLIRNELEQLDKINKLTFDHISLYEKFVMRNS